MLEPKLKYKQLHYAETDSFVLNMTNGSANKHFVLSNRLKKVPAKLYRSLLAEL